MTDTHPTTDLAYVRVSTADQNPTRQHEAIREHLGRPPSRTFEDAASGSTSDRDGLRALLAFARDGDTVHVVSLDRLARSLADLLATVDALTAAGATLNVLSPPLVLGASTDPSARLTTAVLGAVAEFERSLIRERQAEGIAAARSRGVYTGRAPSLTVSEAARLRERVAGGVPLARAAREAGVSRDTAYAVLHRRGAYAVA